MVVFRLLKCLIVFQNCFLSRGSKLLKYAALAYRKSFTTLFLSFLNFCRDSGLLNLLAC